MDRLAKIAVTVGALGILAILLLIGLTVSIITSFDSEPQDFSHQIDYSFELRANGTMNDTEILAPYPEDQKFRQVIENSTGSPNVAISNDFNASTSITDSGYLKLDIGDFRPETREERFDHMRENFSHSNPDQIRRQNISGITEYSSYDFHVTVTYNRTLNTSHGLDLEPHLPSNTTECQNARESGCASTKSFVSYDADDETYMEFDVGIEGRNNWQDGFNRIGNSYRQDFYNSYYENDYLIGSQKRWIELRGREVEGDGAYRRD